MVVPDVAQPHFHPDFAVSLAPQPSRMFLVLRVVGGGLSWCKRSCFLACCLRLRSWRCQDGPLGTVFRHKAQDHQHQKNEKKCKNDVPRTSESCLRRNTKTVRTRNAPTKKDDDDDDDDGDDDDGNGNGISWECQYHEEAVSAQNNGPIFVACTPKAEGPEGPMAPIVTHWWFQRGKIAHIILALGAMLIHSVSFHGKDPRIVRVILVPGPCLSSPYQKIKSSRVVILAPGPCKSFKPLTTFLELCVSSLCLGHADLRIKKEKTLNFACDPKSTRAACTPRWVLTSQPSRKTTETSNQSPTHTDCVRFQSNSLSDCKIFLKYGNENRREEKRQRTGYENNEKALSGNCCQPW